MHLSNTMTFCLLLEEYMLPLIKIQNMLVSLQKSGSFELLDYL